MVKRKQQLLAKTNEHGFGFILIQHVSAFLGVSGNEPVKMKKKRK
eukprot:CAMPEP_0116063546 /NCGR_PEP_ID=MMETSP0322-20121206/8490_1 /TAXON_ID=163516 /ORGANISM="Leptocylindrus danicus var. apora, Strain B651" /LENGTH=44 /DNA_ID= /DNA_START= /DNA_END= /DNA_ORIENTATION=